MKETAINIEIEVNEQILDIRIPNRVSTERLGTLLQPIFAAEQIQLPEHWSLQLASQRIAAVATVALDRYGIVDGDRFTVVAGGEDHDHDE
ncbi:hypothetical protein [Schleiferilactobacillus perolens]|uniref:Ubiquitin-like domain-containing protein n=1 Tax=Schleiferilactobacillus perolens DSM 12744 TaxID=1423792 RepID=A0A0R1MJ56_9LACO|nr:hypothetical protein [Schleiferilactobacillus perolens]KRL08061.1 hypothetical protein FD09_GL001707 [Schleiferilactobacillus perolens DSM 12744]